MNEIIKKGLKTRNVLFGLITPRGSINKRYKRMKYRNIHHILNVTYKNVTLYTIILYIYTIMDKYI